MWIPKNNQRFMPRLMPAKPTIFSFFSKASLGVRGVVWMLVSFVNLLLSGFSEMRSFFSIRRSAVKGNFSIDAMKSSGVIKMMLLTFFALAAMQGELLAQIAQRGTATFAESTSTSVSINKPSGLAVGDLMIATINQSTNNGGVSLSDAALTGWIKPNSGAGGRYYENGDDEWWGVVLYKFADASDVAASNFTFQGDVDADDIQGSIIAFSGVDESTPFDAIGSFTTSATLNTTIIANSIATTVPNTAIVMLAFISDNQSFSGWTSTSPSSLTELFDRAFNATVDMGIGGAWATKTNTGQTGNGTVTIANNVADGAILLALKPKINTATTLASSANPIVYGATPTLTATVTPNSASGTVEFFDGSTSLGIATLTGTTTKTATLTLTAGQVDAGTRSITARYLESTTHNVSTSSALSLTVNQRPIQISGSREYYGTITINSSVLSIANLLSGDNVTIAGTGILSAANAGSRTVTQGALPARVRSATGSTGSNAATSFSVTLPVAPSNGNTLIAVISTRGNSDGRVTGITQTGATWTRAVQRTNVNGTTIEIWYTTALSSAGSGITISQANLRSAAVVIEYSGLLLPESIDVSAGNSGSGTTASTGTTGTTSQANTVLIGGIGFASSSPSLSSISGSFSQVATAASTNGTAGNNAEVFALERIVTSTGTFFSGGIISATTQWSGAIAAFRATIPSGNPLSLSGADAGNYTFSGSTGSVTITPKALTIGPPSITTPSKEYDGTRSTGPVTVGTLSGFVGSETVTATAAGEYADANVGTNKTATITYTLEDGTNGGLASNYSLANGTAIGSITSKSLTITGAITADKVYDGTNTAIVTGGTLVGVVGSDVVSLTQSGTFAQIGVGNNIAITSTSTLGGANAGNYTLIQPSLAARNITAKALTVTG
ncbi:MAG: Ig-like domain repeat protein, partial [Algoriphagus sp.]|nr:Ig-like domain repeat protein [Algoriphagus sp.]